MFYQKESRLPLFFCLGGGSIVVVFLFWFWLKADVTYNLLQNNMPTGWLRKFKQLAHEKWWLEDCFPFGMVNVQEVYVKLLGSSYRMLQEYLESYWSSENTLVVQLLEITISQTKDP